MDRSEKLSLAVRKNRGRQIESEFVCSLAQRLDVAICDIELKDLAATDRLLAEIVERLETQASDERALLRISVISPNVEIIKLALDLVVESASQQPTLLLLGESEFVGAASVRSLHLAPSALELAELDGASVIACSEDLSCVVHLDFVTERYPRTVTLYDLDAWVLEQTQEVAN